MRGGTRYTGTRASCHTSGVGASALVVARSGPVAVDARRPGIGRDEVAYALWDFWHRRVCPVGDRLIVTGELDRGDDAMARRQLAEWCRAGVTTVVDVRAEADDRTFVAEHAPWIRYIWAGVHDHGETQSDEWFDTVLNQLGTALFDPDEVILVHCQMGVNRGPSMAYRILLEQGWGVLDGLKAIRKARPIAEIVYADSAVRHLHASRGTDDAARIDCDLQAVETWMRLVGFDGDVESFGSDD